MKRIIFLIFIMFTLTACKTIEVHTYYGGHKIISQDEKERITFHGEVENTSDESSYLKDIRLIEKKENPKNSIKILDDEIKIIADKAYIIRNINKRSVLQIYDQGVRINSDTFTVDIGRVQLDSGEIINLPPAKIKRYIHIYKINNFLDALNQNTREDLFQGTIEEYREWKKKNMNK